jgi:PEP-CTERM motif
MIALKHVLASAALMACIGGAQAQSASGSFDCITNNSSQSCTQGESTLSWTWNGSVLTINNATGGGYVAEVYFDLSAGMDASFNAGASSSGVLFTAGASPGALPGGNSFGFTSDEAFDSNSNTLGINGGEWAAFSVTGTNGSMDFLSGLHVRSLVNGQSESFVTVTTPVPEPSTYALMLAGLGVVGFVARRRREQD